MKLATRVVLATLVLMMISLTFQNCSQSVQTSTNNLSKTSGLEQPIPVSGSPACIYYGPRVAVEKQYELAHCEKDGTGFWTGRSCEYDSLICSAKGTCQCSTVGIIVNNICIASDEKWQLSHNLNLTRESSPVVNLPGKPASCSEAPVETATCASQGLINHELPVNWAAGHLKDFELGHNQSLSFPIVIPPEGIASDFGFVYGDTYVVVSVSKNKCDFSLSSTSCASYMATTGSLRFSTVATRVSGCTVKPGERYFVNIRNVNFNESLNTNYPVPDYPLHDECTNSGLEISDFPAKWGLYNGCHFSLRHSGGFL